MSLKIKTNTVDEISEDKIEHLKKYKKYYSTGILTYKNHWRIVQNISMYAEQAGIPEYFIYHSCKDILHDAELQYLADFNGISDKGISGGYYESGADSYIDRMYSMVGLMLRNYKDAKFITLQDLIFAIKANDAPKSRLVCIPNFALAKDEGGNVATWELANVLSWILNHHSRGRQVVIYAQDLDFIDQQYGGVLRGHIDNHFRKF